MSGETRKIVAILFSDIVGYTAAMGEDEDRAIRAVSRSRSVQKELVSRYHGQWLQEIGDGALCTFGSAVEAVNCALEIQRAFLEEPDFQVRIGIHVGDLVFRKTEIGHDVFGDAVNVASRVQGVADSGGICISERVYDDLRNHRGIEVRFIGEKQLKNVNRPIRVYAVVDRERPGVKPPETAAERSDGRSRRRRLAAVAAVAAAVAAGVLLLARREGPIEVTSGQPAEPVATSEAAARPLSTPQTFAAARRALLGASGPWVEAAPRVWTEPNPVADNGIYHVRFEARCDCSALLFAVDGSSDEIALLYPNPHEPGHRLVPGESVRIPSAGALQPYSLRAVGGAGMDILKLFVTRGEFDFPPQGSVSWYAEPGKPEAVEQLVGFLESLDAADWASAATPLQIIR